MVKWGQLLPGRNLAKYLYGLYGFMAPLRLAQETRSTTPVGAVSSAIYSEICVLANLIEPWWKQLKSLALKGKRFETLDELIDALNNAVCWWNAYPQEQPS